MPSRLSRIPEAPPSFRRQASPQAVAPFPGWPLSATSLTSFPCGGQGVKKGAFPKKGSFWFMGGLRQKAMPYGSMKLNGPACR